MSEQSADVPGARRASSAGRRIVPDGDELGETQPIEISDKFGSRSTPHQTHRHQPSRDGAQATTAGDPAEFLHNPSEQ